MYALTAAEENYTCGQQVIETGLDKGNNLDLKITKKDFYYEYAKNNC